MLRPQDTPTRERKCLDGLWRLRFDPEGEGRAAGWFGGSLEHARAMAVPASFNDIVVDVTPAGKRQRYFHDFFNYAGIHRHVWLYSTPSAYLDDVTVVTGLDGAAGIVAYVVETGCADGHSVAVTLRDARGAAVASGT